MSKYLWEILVPTVRNNGTPYRTRYHRVWDRQIRLIAGGISIHAVARGQWISPSGDIFQERMIPVRIMCSSDEIERIADLTAAHYQQEAVMFYRVSESVVIKHYQKS